MGLATLILVVNPGSASRKYGLYAHGRLRAQLHFELTQGKVLCTITTPKNRDEFETDLQNVGEAAEHVLPILKRYKAMSTDETIERIGLRIVAPGMFFLEDHLVNNEVVTRLKQAKQRAPLHISATLHELGMLQEHFADTPIIGVSDSTFHSTKPDEAWNYGIALADADRLDIKRFGYHGISVSAAVRTLHSIRQLPEKLVVCHIGSGVSVTAAKNGKSVDNSMGFSPLEGVIMGTRSGNIDATALLVLKEELGLDQTELEAYLNTKGGLLGLSGKSADVRDLLNYEADGDHSSHLALETYLYAIRKAIGQMTAALEGIDGLVFTGTVGERSAIMRNRLVETLKYSGFSLDTHINKQCTNATSTTLISQPEISKPIYVIPTDEAAAIAHHTAIFGR